ncbi:MAG TPA: PEP-CTERM sorting domain-containing protein [Terracidiphilus sp.]|jgi:fibro-slime domain-containing protein
MKFSYLTGLRGKLLAAAGVSMGILALSVPASADSFSVQYFEVSTSSAANSDFHTGNVPTGTSSSDYVLSTLSGGLPVYNPAQTGNATAPNMLGAGNVIEWWTPGTYGPNTVTSTGTSVLNVSTDPNNPTNMFPPNSTGNSNQNGFEETAILTSTFTLGSTQNVTFDVGADDDAFVFIDGKIVLDLGGIHGLTLTPTVTQLLNAGTHTLQIFYADQDEVAASLVFQDNGIPVNPSPAPEPGSLALLGTGVLGLAGTLRRRMKR